MEKIEIDTTQQPLDIYVISIIINIIFIYIFGLGRKLNTLEAET